MSGGYDPVCEKLARHYLGGTASSERISALAHMIQVTIEASIDEEPPAQPAFHAIDCTCESDPVGRCVVHGILEQPPAKPAEERK